MNDIDINLYYNRYRLEALERVLRSQGKSIEDAVYPMEQGGVYNVKKGEWHHIVVSEDAAVLVAEHRDTDPDNTEKRSV